ncbi:MAG: cytochrome c [Actinomycetota bacterium]|nr:cytochrome c [Actinomycetota bacterium]
MNRRIRVLLISIASVVAAATLVACGTEKISVARSDPNRAGAVLFSQRCAGCHTLDAAATHGSAANVRTREAINGPNFNVRCERPVTRVLYAIENGGFSGAYMPQNIVVGQQAQEVARFVTKYAGRKAVYQPGSSIPPCKQQLIGTLPPLAGTPTATTAGTATTATPATTAPAAVAAKKRAKAHKAGKQTGGAKQRKK